MSEGVEWGLHACLVLAWNQAEGPVSTRRIGATFDLPAAYLNKHLQALARAGIVTSTSGPRGGFSLARPAGEITLLDVVEAIEGREEAFRCQEIRQHGLGATLPQAEFRERCVIAAAMRDAETAWRHALAGRTIADVQATVDARAPHAGARMRRWLAGGAA